MTHMKILRDSLDRVFVALICICIHLYIQLVLMIPVLICKPNVLCKNIAKKPSGCLIKFELIFTLHIDFNL